MLHAALQQQYVKGGLNTICIQKTTGRMGTIILKKQQHVKGGLNPPLALPLTVAAELLEKCSHHVNLIRYTIK
jgi:hypothetical protein